MLAVGLVAILVGASQTWVRVGQRGRSSFELAAVADRVGMADGMAAGVLKVWLVLPLLIAVSLACVALGRHRLAIATALPSIVVVSVVAIVVVRSGVGQGAGVWITLAGTLIAWTGIALRVRRPFDE